MEVHSEIIFSNEDIEKALVEFYYRHKNPFDEITIIGKQKIRLCLAGLEAGDSPYLIIKKPLS